MDFQKITTEFLGIQDVVIEAINIHRKSRKIRLIARQKRDACFCTRCGLQFDSVKDWQKKELRVPPLGIYSDVKVLLYQLRGNCQACGFAEVAVRLMEEITCEAVSRILFKDSWTMWRVDQFRIKLMEKRFTLPKNLDVSQLAADEVHFCTVESKKRKGLFTKRYVPELVTNLVSPKHGKVLANAFDRDSEALESCLLKLSPEQLLSVEKFAVDMLEPHRRFILMAREKDLSRTEQKMLDKLRDTNKEIHTGMLLVEYFHRALDKTTVLSFRKALRAWCLVVRESKLEPFLKLAKTIRRYRRQIESYITSGFTTAVAEGLNNKIKILKKMAYGYSNKPSFLRKILQRCGYLNHQYIRTDDLFCCITL